MIIGDPVTSKKTPPKKPPMELTARERELLVEMGYHLALAMWRKLGKSDPDYQSVLNGYEPDVSVYRNACLILNELAVVSRVGDWQYRFAMPLDRVKDHLKTFVPTTFYSLEEIIGNFLWVTAGYDNWVSEEREPFEVAVEMQAAMQALVGLGLATREPEGFVWTDEIAPIMMAEHLWSKEGESFRTLQRQKDNELTERIWGAIPAWRRHLLARIIVGRTRLDAAHYLFWRWDDGRNRLRFTSRPKTGFRMISSEFYSAAYEVIDRLIAVLKRHPF